MTETARTRLEPDDRRAQILSAATALYAERAYDQVSLAELARAAGVTRGLLHHYFGSKREIFLAVMRSSLLMPADELPDLLHLPKPERVRATMDWILDAALTYGQAWVTASGAAELHGESDLQAVVDDADDRAARLVLDAVGHPDDPRSRATLRASAAYVKALCREWLQRGTLTRDDVLDLLTVHVTTVLEKTP